MLKAMQAKSFSFVVKIASRCNLNCTYCYMYNMGDDSYLMQPKKMSDLTIQKLAQRIDSFSKKHEMQAISIILHGGEPLLAGKAFFRRFLDIFRESIADHVKIVYVVQTNALLIDEEWMQLFEELDIKLGISLDGDKETNDRYRIDHKGKGSYDRVIEKYQLARDSQFSQKAPAVLTVINVDADPQELYHHHKSIGIESFDILLPDSNWDKLPPPPSPGTRFYGSPTAYGDWLIALFDEWYNDSNQNKRPRIRKFSQIVQMVLGHKVSADDLGAGDNQLMVIETDGSYEAGDSLKICGPSFTKANTNVHNHEIDEGLNTDLATLYFKSHNSLCRECSSCKIRSICGAGYLPHRYSTSNSFNNTSVYCMDLTRLITHIQNRIVDSLSVDMEEDIQIKKFDYLEIFNDRQPKDLVTN